MAIADRYTGLVWYGNFVTTSGTAVLSGDQKTFEWSTETDMIDSSGGSVGSKEYLSGINDGNAKLTAYDTLLSAAGSALAKQCAEGVFGTITWGPLGTATGKPKYARAARVKSLKVGYPFDGDVMREVEFQFTGPWISNYDTLSSVY